MPTQTYCQREDLEAIWSAAAVTRSVDDDEDGSLSATEEGYIALAIERAANRLNSALETRYVLSDLANNTWCRDANAAVAAYLLVTRRGNPSPEHIARQYEAALADLEAIRTGQQKVPQVADSRETAPSVTNFTTELSRQRAKVRRVEETSTGSPPPAGRKSFPAGE